MNIRPFTHLSAALGFALLSTSCTRAADLPVAKSAAPEQYAVLLKTYATPGGVRYGLWKQNAADKDALEDVVDFYATTLPPSERDAALAWHINAYNAWILHNILAKYPTKGPLAGDLRFFHDDRIRISGKKTSFDHFEQKIIRPTFKEPRVHFALNCASTSCPPLATLPFDAASLDDQLDRLTREFTNRNSQAIQVNGVGVSLSKLFDWYQEDFALAGGALAFINRFREDRLPTDAEVKFMEYDWSLNEVK